MLTVCYDRNFKCFMLAEPLKWNQLDLVCINSYLKQIYRMYKIFLEIKLPYVFCIFKKSNSLLFSFLGDRTFWIKWGNTKHILKFP